MAGEAASQISLRGVTKVFPGHEGHPDVHALGPIDFDVARGEFFTVVGPSGCGKSTLLDVLSGMVKATAGTATFDGKLLAGTVPNGIGAVFQQDASFFWLNVWDNVAFGLRRRGAPARRGRATRRTRRSLSWGSPALPRPIRRNFPAACASASASRARWCSSRKCCCSTSPSARSTSRRGCLMGDELLAHLARDRRHRRADHPCAR